MGGHWKGTTIAWEIVPTGEGAHEVWFTHAGWADDVPPTTLAAVDSNWVQVLDRLKRYAETGQPDPFVP